MKKLLPFTGIRSLAALWVVLFHFRYIFSYGLLQPLIDKGYLGVDLFFILSGFIISYVHQHEFVRMNGRALLNFWVLRCARIFPVHYFALSLIVLLMSLKTIVINQSLPTLDMTTPTGHQLLYHLLNIHAWGFASYNAWNVPSWSVSAEWFAYLFFPFTVPFVASIKTVRSNLLFIAGCFVALGIVTKVLGLHGIDWTCQHGLVRIGCEFLMGCALYNIFRIQPKQSPGFGALLVNLSLALFAIGCFFQIPDIALVLLVLVFLAGLSREEGWLARLLSHRVPVHLGEISFSIYMMHAFVARMFDSIAFHFHLSPHLPAYQLVPIFIVLLAAVVGIAQLVHTVIEVPARNAIRSLLLHRIGYKRVNRPVNAC
jgi:peptidoglycan/LPS O-acetylase OafA/YrhL